MKPQPFSFQFPIADFDLTKLPVEASLLREHPALLVAAVQTFYQDFFRSLGGTANILVKDESILYAVSPERFRPCSWSRSCIRGCS